MRPLWAKKWDGARDFDSGRGGKGIPTDKIDSGFGRRRKGNQFSLI
jgi:hypothetical protein